MVVLVELAPNFPVLLEAALALGRERRTAPIRWIGDQRGPVFAINDGYPRAPIPIDLAVFLAPEPNLCAPGCTLRPSARDGPWVSGTITIWLLDLLVMLGCVDQALVLAALERSERHVRSVPLKDRMAIGSPGNFPVSGVGGSVLRRRGRDDAVCCECTENGEK